ncbi:DUF3169 family protein [Robertmurraya sp. DFI.2.37]|jgi:hypothetical protein|uniref:DUF3169 family protein n=1 Tax=Robertmurraya sp. DFI.2.37 TaxID=3031819 RepID=UPI001245B782|nr:DUF3169 family protein [Robertmurraya sp. DFI.2.37]MDF1509386.1 DUF3169 family protein [Robertmurraya sp. DFI.2.37]
MKILVIYIIIFLFALNDLISHFNERALDANLLMLVNIAILLFLIIARFQFYKIIRGSQQQVEKDKEDSHYIALERKAYTSTSFIQMALSLSFIGLLIGFLLLRETAPSVPFWSFALMIISVFNFFPNPQLMKITNPNFQFPNPQSNHYNQEVIDQFDDGEKYVILKSLLKVYSFLIWGLVILASGLMYYSIFSGNSQLISIIGIGILLILIQISYTTSLKPNKLK